jgi:hypothetical protein
MGRAGADGAVQAQRPGLDQLLQVAARKLRQQQRQRTVEALAMLRAPDGERTGFRLGGGLVDEFVGGLRGVGRYNGSALTGE